MLSSIYSYFLVYLHHFYSKYPNAVNTERTTDLKMHFNLPTGLLNRRIASFAFRYSALCIVLLLSSCDTNFANLPNVSTGRSDTASNKLLPDSLRAGLKPTVLNDYGAARSNPNENAHFQRMKTSIDSLRQTSNNIHRTSPIFLKETALLLENRVNRTLSSRESIAQIQKMIEERCGAESGELSCTAAVVLNESSALRAIAESVFSIDHSVFDDPNAAFSYATDDDRKYELRLHFFSSGSSIRFSAQWDDNFQNIKVQSHAEWTDLDGSKNYKSTFTYAKDHLANLHESLSVNETIFTINQKIIVIDLMEKEISIDNKVTWSSPVDDGSIEINVIANDSGGHSSSALHQQTEGTEYNFLARNRFNRNGQLIENQYCNNNGDIDCSAKNNWVFD